MMIDTLHAVKNDPVNMKVKEMMIKRLSNHLRHAAAGVGNE
jgi:hypothetical protein